jgi:adenylosuccinate lyase
LLIDDRGVARNLAAYGAFAATERLLMELVRAGADRQAMHERIRSHSLAAWQAIQAGRPNPLPALLAADPAVLAFLPAEGVAALLDACGYVGDAPQRAREMAALIRAA